MTRVEGQGATGQRLVLSFSGRVPCRYKSVNPRTKWVRTETKNSGSFQQAFPPSNLLSTHLHRKPLDDSDDRRQIQLAWQCRIGIVFSSTFSSKLYTTMVNPPRKRSSPPVPSSGSCAGKKSKRSSSPTTKTSPDSKASKGLRHFSMKVCRKVEEKGKTTYNEVADELVREVMSERSSDEPRGKYDEKNIRRRVYDALNVLMAMDIISKEKKEILWKGLPSNAHHDMGMLKREGQTLEKEVERKRESLRELLVQQVCFRNLVDHNRKSEQRDDEKIPLPFIVVNTHSTAVIQCEMSSDRTDVMFDFSMPFEINDDNTILKRLGMYVTMI